jgi:hypothetical protein
LLWLIACALRHTFNSSNKPGSSTFPILVIYLLFQANQSCSNSKFRF